MIGVGDILRETRRLLPVDLTTSVFAILLLAGLGFLIDVGIVTNSGFNLVISGATIASQYVITRRLLDRMGYPMPGRPRGLAFVGLGIVSGLGIALGLLLLIVPGVVLLVRWSISTPILLSSEQGVFDSIGESWRQTEGHFWAILGSLLVVYLPGIAIFTAGLVAAQISGLDIVVIAVANLAFNTALVGGWIATVAMFSLLNRSPSIAEIFE